MKRPPDDLAAKLLEASSRLGTVGVDLSIDDMAREAGVARATLYYYFSGKEDLVAFLLDDKVTAVAAAIEKAAAQEGSVPERLRGIVHAVFAGMARQPALCLEMPTALQNPEAFGEVLLHAEEVVMAPLRHLLEEGVDSGALQITDVTTAMTFLQGAIWQVAMVRLLGDGALDADEATESVTPLLLGAFGAVEDT